MTELRLAGDHRTALSHLAPVGLTSILRDGPDPSATFCWDPHALSAVVSTELSQVEIGGAIQAFAAAHSGTWPSTTIGGGHRGGVRIFSPRSKPPRDDVEWCVYEELRESWLSDHEDVLTDLDFAMIGGLGEPAWWRHPFKTGSADDGASRWEMKTRNRGEDFIQHRLSPLMDALTARAPDEVVAGLVGDSLVDETGSARESRTATGLATPRPVDTATAFVALMGMASLPVVRRLGRVAATPGQVPRTGVHPRHAYLPISSTPMSPRRFSNIATSRSFDEIGKAFGELEEPSTGFGLGEWARDQGIFGVLVCRVRKAGSASAPERQILDGVVVVL